MRGSRSWARGLVVGIVAACAVMVASNATAANEQTVALDGQTVILPNQGNNGKIDLVENLAVDCLPGSIVVANKVDGIGNSLGTSLSVTAPSGQVVLAVSVKSGSGNVTTVVFGPNTATVSTTQTISNYVIVYCTPPRVDESPPICVLTASGLNASAQKFIQVTVQDPQSGLQSIVVNDLTNATVEITNFFVGTLNPVLVTATKIDQTQGSFLMLTVTNGQGLVTVCDPPVPAKKSIRRGWPWRPL